MSDDLYINQKALSPAKEAGLKAAQESLAKLVAHHETIHKPTSVSDGSTASYYELPPGASQLQDLISFRNMNAQLGEIFRACYRYGQASHSSCLRDAKKIQFYINAEIERLERWGQE